MLKTTLLISAGLLIGQSLFAQESIKLKDLDLSRAWQEYGILQKGRSVTGEPVTINGTVYDDVLGVQAKSIIKIKLEKNATRFVAQVGIAESKIDVKDKTLTIIPLVDGTKLHFIEKQKQKQFVGVTKSNPVLEKGSVKFTLKGDGKPIFISSVIKGGDRPQQIDVPLKDVMYLELVAETTDDGPSGDHAVWIAPKIDYKTIKPQIVDVGTVGPGANMDARISKKLAAKIKALPLMKQLSSDKTAFDWLITPQKSKAGIYTSADGKNIIIANAMVSRTFRIFPNLATVDITNRMLGESLIRAVSSEGTIQIDGKKWNIGGLNGQEERDRKSVV